jgi:very-short-patch-repair endonuclease
MNWDKRRLKNRSKFKDPSLNKKLWKAKFNPKHKIKAYAQANRKIENKHEMKVYYLLRAFFDFEVLRQFIVDGRYIADLCIPSKKVIIEVDGGYHNNEDQKVKDKIREDYIRSIGFEIIRFKNEEVQHDLFGVLAILQDRFPAPQEAFHNEYLTMIDLPNT